ncbi:MAG TPA: hypothetical protein PLR07_12860, partial [Promineifilum sp.]|nr:hypothetical protein [Promineifilum sp.]
MIRNRFGRRWLLLSLLLLPILAGGAVLPFVSTNPAGLLARLSQRVFAQTHNYDQPDGPFYSGDYASGDYAEGEPDNSAELVVVTYNLRYGEATAEAV